MIKWVALYCICFIASISPQTTISPQFSELKGIEDQQGNTHLFYRIYESYENDPMYWSRNNIYHFDLDNGIDTFFLSTASHSDPSFNYTYWVRDYKFWNNNPAEFIFSGGYSMGPYFEGSAFVERFDGYYHTIDYFWGSADYIDISPSNDSMLYLGVNAYGGFQTLASSDGGRSWDTLNLGYQFLSLNPYFENIYFVENEDRELLRTTDSGNTYNLVDPEMLPDTRFFYDSDQLHIYRKAYNKLIVSDNIGEQFSWETVFTKTTTDQFYFSNDISLSGSIFISEGKNIFHSSDFGSSINLYKTLERKIVGIYKKPNSNKLYAATKYKIYEITPDTIQVIKSLPIPQEVLDLYPLAMGNKWIYDFWGWWADTTYHSFSGVTFREIIGDTIMTNGKFYYELFDPTTFNYPPYLFERIDTSSGKVYRYDGTLGLPNDEYLIDDLLAEVGDSIYSSRHQYQDYFPFVCVAEGIFNKWGIQSPRKIFTIFDLTGYTYSLSQSVGVDSIYDTFDFGENFVTLKGCIIDGVIYGDTTTVDVRDEGKPFVNKFKLDQNYPNPFNPTTKISFVIGHLSFVTLKVFDILGNEIATLVNEEKKAGEYEVEFNASGLPSGIYFYQLKAGSFIQTKKMVLLK